MPISVPAAFSRFAQSILLVWALAAGMCGCGKPATVNSESKSTRPIIEITPDPLVITANEDGNTSPVTLKLRNVSSTTIELTQPKSTCTCTIVTPLKSTRLAPQETLELELKAQPPAYGEQTAALSITTSHPELPLIRIPVVLHGKQRAIPFVFDHPRSIELSLRGTAEHVTSTMSVTCAEQITDEPWLLGFESNDANLNVCKRDVQEGLHISETAILRQYTFEIIARRPFFSSRVVEPIAWKVETTTGLTLPDPIAVRASLVPFLRVVPDTLLINVSPTEVKTSHSCLVFFDSDSRLTLGLPNELPAGLQINVITATSTLPPNATRLEFKADTSQLLGSNQERFVVLPIHVSTAPETTAEVKLRLRRTL